MATRKYNKLYRDRTKGDVENSLGRSVGRAKINRDARRNFLAVRGSQDCYLCGYNKHTEVCHIKAISAFSDDTLVGEINHIGNLVALCPNHHWEFDNGIIDIEFPIYYQDDNATEDT
jgi:predicted restriction endonuclease